MRDDTLVTTAFIGTARRPRAEIHTGTAVDGLVQELADKDAEQKLLLSAGARAIYLQAGKVAETLTTTIQPCEPEVLPACSPSISALLVSMIEGEFKNLLPIALMRLQKVGQRVPHTIVDSLLSVKDSSLHNAIYPVLGKRGIWLSQFNPMWSWVLRYQLELQEIEHAQLERTWQEGTAEQREVTLHYLRTHDVATARRWLDEVWSQEKAETRGLFLDTLLENLSSDDELLLEKALDDRSSSVRVIAATTLLFLPSSALRQRMCQRGDSMLSYAKGKLLVHLPASLPKDWIRDGITTRPAVARIAENVWWFTQVLSKIPLSHWEDHFGLSISKLIAALDTKGEWYEMLLSAWISSANFYQEARWCMALWDYGRKRHSSINESYAELLSCMPQQDAEWRCLDLFRSLKADENWAAALYNLPGPWSKEFSEAYLKELRSYLKGLDFDLHAGGDSWFRSMQQAPLELSPSCFAQALRPMELAELPATMTQQNYKRHYWEQELTTFVETIRVHRRIMEEIQ